MPTPSFIAAYLQLPSDELERRATLLNQRLRACDLCPRRCGVNRTAGGVGACQTAEHLGVASFGPHFGEEAPLVGRRGSGTIFFSGCNLRCVFCQNWEISQQSGGRTVTAEELAAVMLKLQQAGCHNINLVSPSHVVAQIVAALPEAVRLGLRLPLVYNTGGYDALETLSLLDGIVDIYMPDMKFADSTLAAPYLGVADYAEVNRAAVLVMHRQVGDLLLGELGIARRGLLVRHLVLPDNLAGSAATFGFLARQVSVDTWLNVMDQYRPCHRAGHFPPLDRRPTRAEISAARQQAEGFGLRRFEC
jgi:putative pyruvate formate lyase activating enzyme